MELGPRCTQFSYDSFVATQNSLINAQINPNQTSAVNDAFVRYNYAKSAKVENIILTTNT